MIFLKIFLKKIFLLKILWIKILWDTIWIFFSFFILQFIYIGNCRPPEAGTFLGIFIFIFPGLDMMVRSWFLGQRGDSSGRLSGGRLDGIRLACWGREEQKKKEKRKKRRVRYPQKERGTWREQRTSTEGPEIERKARLDLLTRDFLLVQVWF